MSLSLISTAAGMRWEKGNNGLQTNSRRLEDWFEARGPDDPCDAPRETEQDPTGDDDDAAIIERKRRPITVCRGVSKQKGENDLNTFSTQQFHFQVRAGSSKCICVKSSSSLSRNPSYRLECGVCVDPCSHQFVPVRKRNKMSNDDLKRLLLENFFDEIVN